MLGSRDSPTASISIVFRAFAGERLLHVPFGARIEESQSVPSLQCSIVGNPDFEFAHIEY